MTETLERRRRSASQKVIFKLRLLSLLFAAGSMYWVYFDELVVFAVTLLTATVLGCTSDIIEELSR